ncbi:MAG TPA: sigma-70 family RNA polymerase sigma factor [Oligoflexia bacterium]|nr:sigma-70 family RNA polymerase sigma factor [Oligoflexia bacterium]HMP27553.1 sigma-70 family RNA polymerase sigma factor [Oligoflexia bacterium]
MIGAETLSGECKNYSITQLRVRSDIESLKPYVRRIAFSVINTLRLPQAGIEDYLSAGYVGLLEAAARYNPDTGVDFKYFAFSRIRGSILDYVRQETRLSASSRRKLQLLQSTAMNFERNYKRKHLDKLKIKEANKSLSTSRKSGVTSAQSERQRTCRRAARRYLSDTLASLLDFLALSALTQKMNERSAEIISNGPVDPNDPEGEVLRSEQRRLIKRSLAALSKKDRLILEECYYQDRSISDLGKEKNLSRSWLSRKHQKALQNLKKNYLEIAAEDEI